MRASAATGWPRAPDPPLASGPIESRPWRAKPQPWRSAPSATAMARRLRQAWPSAWGRWAAPGAPRGARGAASPRPWAAPSSAARGPDFIRENLPLAWLAATLWYRAEVRNMGHVPEEGPVLLVGNHSGGNMAPEVIILPLAFSTFFGVERPFYQLAHNLVLASPVGPFLRRFGTMAASHDHA